MNGRTASRRGVCYELGRLTRERTVWNRNAGDPGRDATHVTANTTLPRRPGSRLRANASRADASGKTSTDGGRSSPASASLASDVSWSRFGSTMKYTPPSGGSSATETSRPPARSTARGPAQPLAADGVEHEVDGLHRVLEARRRVDGLVCAELADQSEVRRRCGPDHVRAARAGELHGEPADAARGTVDQHALARGEPAVVEQPLPGGERGQRDRGALGVPERPRPGHQQLGRHAV